MKKIFIPFLPEMQAAILAGKKTCTSRTKRYGEIGDYFFIGTKKFALTSIDGNYLQFIRDYYYMNEGFNAPEEFESIWKKLHPRKGFCPDQSVLTHWFKEEKINEET
jgi:hypothetical protein